MGKSLNIPENFISKEEKERLEHTHYCEGCGKELSFEDYTNGLAETIYDFLQTINEKEHLKVYEVLSGLNKTMSLILDDFFEECGVEPELQYAKIDDDMEDLLTHISKKNNNRVDAIRTTNLLNYTLDDILYAWNEQLNGKSKE